MKQNINHRKAQETQVLLPPRKLNLQISTVFITMSNSQSLIYMEDHEWRKSTNSPVVKATSCEVKDKNHQSCILKIRVEPLSFLISELRNISLFRTIYLLKESLIGFFNLTNRYGNFNVTSSMIAIDQSHKCKVWHNQDFSLNYPQSMSTEFTLTKIYGIFQEITLKTITNKIFFQELKAKGKNFFQGLNYIEFYVKSEKILVPHIFHKIQEGPPTPKVHRVFQKFMNYHRNLCSTHDLIKSSLQKQKLKTNKTSKATTAESHQTIKKNMNSRNYIESQLFMNVNKPKQSQYCFDRRDEQQKRQKTENNEQPDDPEYETRFKINNWNKCIGLDSARNIKKSIHIGKPEKQIGHECKLDKLDQLGKDVGASDSQNNQDREEDEEICRPKLQSRLSSSVSHL